MNLIDMIKTEDGSKPAFVGMTTSDELMKFVEEISMKKLAMEREVEAEKKSVEYLTPDEVCKLLKTTRSSLTRWQKSGYLVPSKAGGKCFYSRARINALLNEKSSK